MTDFYKRPRVHSLGVHGVAFIEVRRVPNANGVEIVCLPKEGFSDFTLYVYGDEAVPIITQVDEQNEPVATLPAPTMVEESAYGRFEYPHEDKHGE